MKQFSIGVNRYVSVKKQEGELSITVGETNSEFKTVTFPAKRWINLTSFIEEIDESVNKLIMKQNVDMKLTIRRLSIRLFYLAFSINGDKRIWKFSTPLSTVFNPKTRLNANENYVVSKYFYTIRNSF